MKRRLFVGIVLYLALSHLIDWGPFDLLINVYAQTTTVTGTVKDINGIPYSGAQMSAQLVFAGTPVSNPTVTISVLATCKANGFGIAPCQVPFASFNGPFTLDLSGNIPGGGITLQDNSLVTPAGTQWAFKANSSGTPPPLGTGPQVCSSTVTISGSSQSVTTNFIACPGLALTTVATSGNPFIGAIPAGASAEYRILPGENPAALTDYTGNGNTGIGTTGTAPTIVATTGGLACPGAGASILPPSLNSSKTIIIVASMNFGSGTYSPVFGNGNGTGTGGTGIVFQKVVGTTGNNLRVLSVANNAASATQKSFIGGQFVVALSMDTVDHIYINGKEEPNYYGVSTSSAGLMAAGSSYQLCGSATGGSSFTPNFLGAAGNGPLYYAIFYPGVLTPAQHLQAANALLEVMPARAVRMQLSGTTVQGISNGMAVNNSCHFTWEGDSITAGFGITTPWPSLVNLISTGPCAANGWDTSNQGLTGEAVGCPSATGSSFILNGDFADDPAIRPAAPQNGLGFWGGTNDFNAGGCPNTAPGIWGSIVQYGLARKAAGWRVGLTSMISRTGQDANKNALNPLQRQSWRQAYDWLCDMGGTTQMGADGSNASALWFQGDGIHPNQNAASNLVVWHEQRCANRFYGNKDYTSATVYTTGAPAAVATTGGSEATNTVTITFAGANTCTLGILCTCTGITPAGYNQTYVAQGGSNATTLIGFNLTTGLGAITVQGSCSSPQQQDPDDHLVVNMGAVNFTLQPHSGLTGQATCIKNINAAATSIVAFAGASGSNTPWAAELIDGSPTFSLAPNTAVCLEARLISQAAGGVNLISRPQ